MKHIQIRPRHDERSVSKDCEDNRRYEVYGEASGRVVGIYKENNLKYYLKDDG